MALLPRGEKALTLAFGDGASMALRVVTHEQESERDISLVA